ncbi:AsnC family transcriptional regulator, partial [Georgenia ruanii]|nr:AsnC family transcriptional regulator [Georgenia ruanii]
VDMLDESLLRLLQEDGRASYSDLAKKVGVNRSVVASRVNHFLSSGEVRVTAAVHPRLLGLAVLAHLALRVTGDTRVVTERLDAMTSAVFVSETTGAFQVVAELRVETMSDLYEDIARVRELTNVVDVQVLVYEHVIRSLFLGEEPSLLDWELDDTDIEIMRILQHNGRVGYAELSAAVGLSVSACRTRVLRLLDAHVMRVGAIRSRHGGSASFVFGMGISPAGGVPAVLDLLASVDGVEFVARTVGRYAMVATVAVKSLAEYNDLLRAVRRLPGVSSAETWIHADIVRERYESTLDRLIRDRQEPLAEMQ